MGFTKDLWLRTEPAGPDGKRRKVRTDRYGKGKRWLAVWHGPDDRERSKAFEKKVDADQYWAAHETDISRGDYIDPNAGRVQLSEFGTRWLKSRTADPASVIKYTSSYRHHVEKVLGHRQVRSVKPSEIAEWLTDLVDRYGTSTARTALTVIQGTLDLAVADEAIKRNPAKSTVVPSLSRAGRNIVAWDDETVRRIIDGHSPRFQPIPVVGAACGLRQGEIFGLAEEDIDYENRVIHVRRQVKVLGRAYVFALPKNDQERDVPLPDWAAQTLRGHAATHQPRPYTLPWEKPDGAPVTVSLMLRWTDDRHIRSKLFDELVWKPALVRAGVLPHPTKDKRGRTRFPTDRRSGTHALRHAYASWMLADGVNIRELAEYLGHKDPGFTLRQYAHLLPTSHERARKAIDARMLTPRARSDGTVTEQAGTPPHAGSREPEPPDPAVESPPAVRSDL